MTPIQLGNTLARFRKLYNKAFNADTVYGGTFNAESPAAGHCAIVAMDVFFSLGGELVSCKVGGISHWYNLINGVYLDVTGDQFGRPVIQIGKTPLYEGEHKSRNIKEVSEETWNRYKIFVSRLGKS